MNPIEDKVTLLIKTFERPSCLNRLLGSIRIFYPTIKIIIVDDSKNINKINDENSYYIHTSFDTGASYCRNLGLSFVKTPFVVTLDDDFVFTEKTKLNVWLEILENSNIDLISGNVGNARYEACFRTENNILEFIKKNRGFECRLPLYDIVLQFWCARVQKIKEFGGWDDQFLTVDHLPFFLCAFNKIKISYCNEVSVDHYQERNPYYDNFRHGKVKDYYNLIAKKYNFNKIIGYNGETLYDNK